MKTRSMTQWILSVAAVYNAAWVVLLLLRPEKVLLKTPPLFGALIAGVGLVGVAFAVCAVKPRRPLLGLTILAKLGGVASFAVAVSLGYLAWSQWWMPVVNDLVWLPVLVHIWNQEVWS